MSYDVKRTSTIIQPARQSGSKRPRREARRGVMIFAWLQADQVGLGNVDLNTWPLVVMMAFVIVLMAVGGGLALRNLTRTSRDLGESNNKQVSLFSDAMAEIQADAREDKRELRETNEECAKTLSSVAARLEEVNLQQIEHGRQQMAHGELQTRQNALISQGIAESRADHQVIIENLRGQDSAMTDFINTVQDDMSDIKKILGEAVSDIEAVTTQVTALTETKGENKDEITEVKCHLRTIDETLKAILLHLETDPVAPANPDVIE